MKKIYINPELEIVEVCMQQQMLAGSNRKVEVEGSGDASGAEASSMDDDIDW